MEQSFAGAIARHDEAALSGMIATDSSWVTAVDGQDALYLLMQSWPHATYSYPPPEFDRCLRLLLMERSRHALPSQAARHAESLSNTLSKLVARGYFQTLSAVAEDLSVRAILQTPGAQASARHVNGAFLLELAAHRPAPYPLKEIAAALLDSGLRADEASTPDGTVSLYSDPIRALLHQQLAPPPVSLHPDIPVVCEMLYAQGATTNRHTLRAAISTENSAVIGLVMGHCHLNHQDLLYELSTVQPFFPGGVAVASRILLEITTQKATGKLSLPLPRL